MLRHGIRDAPFPRCRHIRPGEERSDNHPLTIARKIDVTACWPLRGPYESYALVPALLDRLEAGEGATIAGEYVLRFVDYQGACPELAHGRKQLPKKVRIVQGSA